ncbi:MAG: DUF927 domain-containing protein [Clostridia bacterium]|nr:DUF927 domain-containing protein [Clostridia bacterium]
MQPTNEMESGNAANPELVFLPEKYEYTYQDFLTEAPYEKLYDLHASPFLFQTAVVKMNARAKEVKFVGFKDMLKRYLETRQSERRKNLVPNQTEFDGQAMELNCGIWESTDWGIYRETPMGGREYACAHPIMPVERLVNIDTDEVKIKLAYKRSGRDKRWLTTIVGKDIISTARSITTLATQGISVTSSTASTLVDYLNDMENLNYDLIPESKSIGRLGYIPGEGFSPYVPDLVFDGDASFKHLYVNIKSSGYFTEWLNTIMECRRMSVTARIMIAASFAAPILSIVGALPFFVHLWGVDSGTGKTVALMAAASVWGNPALGSYVQTFNATQVGQERTAAFLNHLPFCIDELQLTKDSHGRSNFDVYQLAQGVGRSRGKRSGGVEMTPTWSCCFLTTGESPIFGNSAGAGAVNRVIDIECTAGDAVIKDGQRISGVLKQNYGFAGEIFVDKLYSSESILQQVRDVYNENFHELRQGDSTEKQAMAAAAILTADFLATIWIYGDDGETLLTADEIAKFLASRDAVSAGKRAYDWLCDWVASNASRFYSDIKGEFSGEIYGVLEHNTAYIIRGIFMRALTDAGFSSSATISYLKSNNLIETRGRANTKSKRINGVRTECIVLRLPTDADSSEYDGQPL